MFFEAKHLTCLCGLLLAQAAAAGAEPRQPPISPAQPDLAALPTPTEIAAAGEGGPAQAVRDTSAKTVVVDGETVALEEHDIDLEGTSFKALYRRGPIHIPK